MHAVIVDEAELGQLAGLVARLTLASSGWWWRWPMASEAAGWSRTVGVCLAGQRPER
jgi:hypothetical protein